MSYANAVSHNAEPVSQQPHPDTGLLNTESSQTAPYSSDTKVNVAPADFKEHPKVAATRIQEELESSGAIGVSRGQPSSVPSGNASSGSSKNQARKEKAEKALDDAEEKGLELFERAKHIVLQPGVAGGLLGLVNIAVLGTVGYKLYTEPGLRSDRKFLGIATAGTVALFGAEGALAEAYAKTDAGRAEAERAKKEGAAFYNQAKTVVLRPGVLGGIVGVVNVGILGTVGYLGYAHWDQPSWDRRVVSATTAGILALFAAEGFLGKEYADKELPKHK